jgi:hypothetical protein
MRKTVAIKDKGKHLDAVAYDYVVIGEFSPEWTYCITLEPLKKR